MSQPATKSRHFRFGSKRDEFGLFTAYVLTFFQLTVRVNDGAGFAFEISKEDAADRVRRWLSLGYGIERYNGSSWEVLREPKEL